MNIQLRRWSASIGAAVATASAAALLLASGASATPPTKESFAEPYAFSVNCADVGDFDFENLVAGEFKAVVTTIYDVNGTAVKVKVFSSYKETNTNSVSQKTLRVSGVSTEIFDLVLGTRTVVGKVVLATDPSVGVAFQDTGRVIFDRPGHVAFLAGPHEALFAGLDQLVCGALATA